MAQSQVQNETRNQEKEMTQQEREQAYRQHVEQTTPKYSMPVRMAKAFLVGGIICVIGQGILNYATNSMGLDKETAGSWCSMLLRLYIYPGLAHCFKKTVFDMQRTHMVIDHPHGDSGPSPLHQDVCYFLADCIIFKDIVLKMDKLTRR